MRRAARCDHSLERHRFRKQRLGAAVAIPRHEVRGVVQVSPSSAQVDGAAQRAVIDGGAIAQAAILPIAGTRLYRRDAAKGEIATDSDQATDHGSRDGAREIKRRRVQAGRERLNRCVIGQIGRGGQGYGDRRLDRNFHRADEEERRHWWAERPTQPSAVRRVVQGVPGLAVVVYVRPNKIEAAADAQGRLRPIERS